MLDSKIISYYCTFDYPILWQKSECCRKRQSKSKSLVACRNGKLSYRFVRLCSLQRRFKSLSLDPWNMPLHSMRRGNGSLLFRGIARGKGNIQMRFTNALSRLNAGCKTYTSPSAKCVEGKGRLRGALFALHWNSLVLLSFASCFLWI